MKKKGLALVLALALLVIGVVGGTLAWLTAKSDTVVNTFTTSDIKVELKETTGTQYKMIPGYELTKDPKATVLAGSEECFLFVKLEEKNNTYGSGDTAVNFLSYDIADGWTELTGVEGVSGVYYRKVLTADIGTAFQVLKDNKVTVSGDVTKEMMNSLTDATYPTLTVTAYASQLYKSAGVEFTAAEAWGNIK